MTVAYLWKHFVRCLLHQLLNRVNAKVILTVLLLQRTISTHQFHTIVSEQLH